MGLLAADDLAAVKQLHDACCRVGLSLVRTDSMHLRIERLYSAVVCVKGHRPYPVCPFGKPFAPDDGPYPVGTHELGAVEQGKAFLGLEFQRLPSEFRPYFGRWPSLPLVFYFSKADEGQGEVGERGEVS